MTQIRLRNTKTRKVEEFAPIDPNNVRMYLCGPTVYDRAHLGNARPVVVFDVLYRLLRHVYGADHVTYVRNFTDVDDKINATALARQQAGAPGSLEELIRERTEETIGWYHADMDALGALRPNFEPRATDFIGAMVAMIADLIAKGHAYAKDGHVLFRVRSYENYGALSGRSVDDMIAGARVEVAPFKEDPMDFVLWKPSDAGLPGWDSPWGRGRPGWHIECSAMSYELLGASFDIHAGGIDLQFPHHENEIAQSCCAHPEGHFANYWLHNEMLQVEGKKMSKSLGNFFTVRDLLDQGIPGEVIRFVFLQTHYGKPMDWTAEKAAQAEATLRKWRALVAGVEPAAQAAPAVIAALADDLNTAGAIAELHALSSDPSALKASAGLLGLLEDGMGDWAKAPNTGGVSDCVERVLIIRAEARSQKNWVLADAIRDALKEAGIRVKDGPSGATWSLEKDEIDSSPYFQRVRAAWESGDPMRIRSSLETARAAGVHFSDTVQLDTAPAWRGLPTDEHVVRTLSKVLTAAGENK
jgi:cysteinyl-tRNA synthetase